VEHLTKFQGNVARPDDEQGLGPCVSTLGGQMAEQSRVENHEPNRHGYENLQIESQSGGRLD
jgi:hypothetical protein